MKITFDKSTARLVLDALEDADTCSFCGVKLAPDNFAGATRSRYSCSSLPCLIDLSEIIEESE